jgi:hypothetical protein
VLPGAGTYRYQDADGTAKGTVSVPMVVKPASGTTGTTFTITWSKVAAPLFDVFDVQIKRPGSSSFVTWQNGVDTLSAKFKPDAGAGTYRFRARFRFGLSGTASGYSAIKSISVA